MQNYNTPIEKDYYDFLEKSKNKLEKSKKHTLAVLDYWDSIKENPLTPNMSANVQNCSSWLKFRYYTEIDKKTLNNARFCKKDKICPACAARRASKQVQKVMQQLQSNIHLMSGSWYYIVIPVKHHMGEDFMTVFDRLQLALKKINQTIRDKNRGKNVFNWFSQFDGIMYSIEETKTDNGWNIHANLLCRTEDPLQGLIKKPNKNAFWSVEAVKTLEQIADGSKNISITPINISNDEDLLKNLQEVFKYSLKFQDLHPEDLLTAYLCLYKKRLLGTMGTLRGLKVEVELNGDDVENQLFIETLYRYTSKYTLRGHQKGKTYKNGYSIYSTDYFEE